MLKVTPELRVTARVCTSLAPSTVFWAIGLEAKGVMVSPSSLGEKWGQATTGQVCLCGWNGSDLSRIHFFFFFFGGHINLQLVIWLYSISLHNWEYCWLCIVMYLLKSPKWFVCKCGKGKFPGFNKPFFGQAQSYRGCEMYPDLNAFAIPSLIPAPLRSWNGTT